MEQNVYFQNSKGNKLFGVLSNPNGDMTSPIIIIVHGHSSSNKSKNLVKLSEMINKKGVASFRIDLYGHGQSEGKFEEATVGEAVDSILSAIKYVKSNGYTKIGLVGSSFGGIASIIAASKTDDLFVLALKSPVSNYSDLYLWRGTSIEDWKEKGYREYPTKTGMERLNYVFYEDAIQNDGYEAKNISIPTLIVHGDADDEVPTEQSIKLSKLLPNCKLSIVKGADHTYTNETHSEQMLNEIVDYILNIEKGISIKN